MERKPLLSVLIATKNRQKYCLNVVESILSLKFDDIEVVVQDNSDEQNLETMLVNCLKDGRLKYRYTPPPFSSIANFNAAIELSTGEYVCLIGDDDGINPEIMDAVKWASENNIDSIAGNIGANYRWEGTNVPNTRFTKMSGATLSVADFTGNAKFIDIEKSLDALMQNGCTNYLEFELPKLYHGAIKRSVLENIKNETGEYIKGLSPDIYAAISLASRVNKSVYIDYPLTIPGVCGQSTSVTEGQLKKHSKKLEDAPHFRDRGEYFWAEEVPKIYCVQTIWADSGFAALREMKRNDLIAKFNKYALYANILVADHTLQPQIDERIVVDKAMGSFSNAKWKTAKTAKKAGHLFKRIRNRAVIILQKNSLVVYEGVKNIFAAMLKLEEHLKSKNILLSEKLKTIKF